MPGIAYVRQGSGEPLVLIHALGLSKHTWDPVLPALAERFDVIALDLPGFGASAPLPDDVEPSPAMLAASVGRLLDELGIDAPHVVGNSIGGWITLELALQRPLASLTLLSPAGLWRDSTPWYDRISLNTSRALARYLRAVLVPLMRFRLARLIVLGQTHGHPMRLTPAYARATVLALGMSRGFPAAMAATTHRRFEGGAGIDVPVTLAWGERDVLLLKRQSRNVDQLPAHTHVVALPKCGHVSMSDDPSAVVQVVVGTTTAAVRPSVRWQPQLAR